MYECAGLFMQNSSPSHTHSHAHIWQGELFSLSHAPLHCLMVAKTTVVLSLSPVQRGYHVRAVSLNETAHSHTQAPLAIAGGKTLLTVEGAVQSVLFFHGR